MTMQAPRHSSAVRYDLSPYAHYEIDRVRAGNRLFCHDAHASHLRPPGPPPLYEDAALLLKILLAHGLPAPDSYHRSICHAAEALAVAARLNASGADCAEFLLYSVQGRPPLNASKTVARLKAMIGTFYTNYRTRQSIPRDR